MDDEDNTLLWIALGAALVYFFMRQNATASPNVPLLPAPSGGWGGSGTGPSTGVTFNASNPGEIPVPSVTPGGAVVIPGENSSSITLDPIFGMNPGEPYSWD